MAELDLPSPKQVPTWVWIAGVAGVFLMAVLKKSSPGQQSAPSDALLAAEFDSRFREFQEQLYEWMRFVINPKQGVIPVNPPSAPVDHGNNICQGDPLCEKGFYQPPDFRKFIPVEPPPGNGSSPGPAPIPVPWPPMPPFLPTPAGGQYMEIDKRGKEVYKARTNADIVQ